MILSTVKSSKEVIQGFYQSYHILFVATQISCWPSGFFGTIQRKCVNYYLESLCKVHSLQRLSQNTRSTFISDQNKLFKTRYQFNPDASLLHCKVGKHFLIISSLTQMKTQNQAINKWKQNSYKVVSQQSLSKLNIQAVKRHRDVMSAEIVNGQGA